MQERDEETGRLMQYRGPAESPDCAHCPCAKHGRPENPIRGNGPTGGLAIVAEGPGTEECFQKWVLVGPTGKLFNLAFKRGGIDRHTIWLTNSVLCRRPADDNQFARAVECCRPRLRDELALIKPTGILAAGGVAARALQLPVTVIGEARGTVQESPIVPGVPVVTTLHPASLFKGGAGEVSGGKQKMNVDAQMMFLQADIEKAYAIAAGRLSPKWSDDVFVVSTAEGALEAMQVILAEARAWGMLGLDMEWSPASVTEGKITWLGLGHGGKWSGGSDGRSVAFWKPALPPAVLQLVIDAMADETLPKLIWNLQADKQVWERDIGSPMRGRIEDGMLMHHAAFPGLAHDLQQAASQFLVVPPWKTQRREERKATETRMKDEAKATAKVEKKRMHDEENARKRAEAEAVREAKKAAKQAEHEARNAAAAAAKEAKKAQRQAEHEARNAQTAADAAARKAARKATTPASPLPPPVVLPSTPAPSPVVPVLNVGPHGPAGYQFSVIDDEEGVFIPNAPPPAPAAPNMEAALDHATTIVKTRPTLPASVPVPVHGTAKSAKVDPSSLPLPVPSRAPASRIGKIAAAVARMQAAAGRKPAPVSAPVPAPVSSPAPLTPAPVPPAPAPAAPTPPPAGKHLRTIVVIDGKEVEVK